WSPLRCVFVCALLTTGVSPLCLAAAPQAAPQSSATEEASSDPKPRDHARDSAKKTQEPPGDASRENALDLQTIKNIVRDQRQIWTSPAYVRLGHADWLVPYAGLTAGFLVTDR